MSVLKDLYLFKEEDIDDTLVYVDEFYNYIIRRTCPTDRIKITRTNFLEEIRRHKSSIITLSHGKAITVNSVLRYVFRHHDDFKLCKEIASQISATILPLKHEESQTSLELYKKISTLDFRQATEKLRDITLELEEQNIPSLQTIHKSKFTEAEWTRILLFENYFYKYVASCENFELDLKKKWETFEHLRSILKSIKCINGETKAVIKQGILRQETFEKSQNVEIWAKKMHQPKAIEQQIRRRIDMVYPDASLEVICVDTDHSTMKNSLMVIIGIAQQPDFKDISRIVIDILATKHQVNILSEIIFLQLEVFDRYRRPQNSVARFHLRDDIFQGKMKDFVLDVIHPDQLSYLEFPSMKCDACFEEDTTKPLSLQTFSLLQEWILDVPLDMQLILESFINRTSLYNSESKETFLLSKLDRLYGVYDTLLNTFNKNFIGVLQQANTDELAMHYQSITTVFSIASISGISSSYVTAENKIKEKAVDETCYYNTYLKRFPLEYQSTTNQATNQVNLRGCYLILMMDNLVCLTFRSDPDPGENRSGQICTLPLTLQA